MNKKIYLFFVFAFAFIALTGCSQTKNTNQTTPIPSDQLTNKPDYNANDVANPQPTPAVTQPPPSSPVVSAGSISIQNFSFNPATINIKVGGSITWTNNDSVPHQIAADDNNFSSNPLSNGETYQYTFTQAGVFNYHCAIHPSMKGQITVTQ